MRAGSNSFGALSSRAGAVAMLKKGGKTGERAHRLGRAPFTEGYLLELFACEILLESSNRASKLHFGDLSSQVLDGTGRVLL